MEVGNAKLHTETDRQSQIAEQSSILDERINSLDSILEDLNSRLSPVTRPIEPACPCEKAIDTPLVLIADDMRRRARHIARLKEIVIDIIQRLEL
jgi:hypothetical protein